MNSFSGTKVFKTNDKIENATKDELAYNLYLVMTKRKLAERHSARFANHPVLSSVLNLDNVQSEMFKTMNYALNAWEVFTRNKLEQRKKTYQKKKNRSQVIKINKRLKELNPAIEIDLQSKTKLHTFGQLTGYFINAVKNNLIKVYNAHYNTTKRGNVELIHLDSFIEEKDKENYDLKHDLITADMKIESLEAQLQEAKDKNIELQKEIVKLQTELKNKK